MKHLEVSDGTIQWLVTGYMLVIRVILPSNSLLVIFGLSDFTVGPLISALAPNFAGLLIDRMIQELLITLFLAKNRRLTLTEKS